MPMFAGRTPARPRLHRRNRLERLRQDLVPDPEPPARGAALVGLPGRLDRPVPRDGLGESPHRQQVRRFASGVADARPRRLGTQVVLGAVCAQHALVAGESSASI